MSKVCRKCNLAWKDSDDIKFCIYCGAPLEYVPDQQQRQTGNGWNQQAGQTENGWNQQQSSYQNPPGNQGGYQGTAGNQNGYQGSAANQNGYQEPLDYQSSYQNQGGYQNGAQNQGGYQNSYQDQGGYQGVPQNQGGNPVMNTLSKKDFLKLDQNAKIRKELKAVWILCYIFAAFNLVITIASQAYIGILDVLLLAVLGLIIQLTCSRAAAIVLLIYGIYSVLISLIVNGQVAGYLIVLVGIFAVMYTSKFAKEWKKYKGR